MTNKHRLGPDLALTPPMGWNSYNTFCCEPTEALIKEAADAMVSTGLRDAGYVYINIDDGWMAKERDADGNLVPDPVKFPNGMKVVVDYIHDNGLKAGIYLGCGIRTYGERPGSFGYEKKDAMLIASLGFDLLKYDYRDLPEDPPGRDVKKEYMYMRDCLVEAGRPMVFNICEHGRSKPWEWGAEVGHYWRTTPDIKDGYDGKITWGLGFKKIIDDTHHLYPYAGPGGWNDPDMLVVGLNGKIEWQGPGCTETEYRTHFALWCLSAAPLLIGCDIRNMDDVTKEILMNKGLIAVNQDPLGKQGRIVKRIGKCDIWIKPLSGGSLAVGAFNTGETKDDIEITWDDLELPAGCRFTARDLWTGGETVTRSGKILCSIEPHAMAVYRLTPN